jgi:hypothetical protein
MLICAPDFPAMIRFSLTSHALQRAKERAGWRGVTLARMVDRVFFTGVGANTPCRKIREFLRSVQAEHAGRYARAYGEHVFLFATGETYDEAVLVTVLRLPAELRAAARDAKRRRWPAPPRPRLIAPAARR